MIGLLKKDVYLIIRSLQPIILIAVVPPLFAASQNPAYIMMIISIVIPLIFVSNLTNTMSLDEKENWRKNLTAMPISVYEEAGSKFILLSVLALIAVCIVFFTGIICAKIFNIDKFSILIYMMLSSIYALGYGFITIPASFRFGTANSRYFFMLFVLIPTMIPVILNTLRIKIDISWLENLHVVTIILIVLIAELLIGVLSFYITTNILKKKKLS
ncbi:MAG: hypothetical protein PWP30_1291 [Eubacteriaceae bacterium]|nr:hypothetical protein [Eubacteriaceae bacterium]